MIKSTPNADQPASSEAVGYWEGEALERGWRYLYSPEFVPLLVDYLGVQPGMKMLEVGSGTGYLARLLARQVDDLHIVGLEGDEELVQLGRQKLAMEGLADRITFRQGDAYNLPFPDDQFDLVTSHNLL